MTFQMLFSSIMVWSAKCKNATSDYHGSFNFEIFEDIFEKLCASLTDYGKCIIHMDGTSYHLQRSNPIPNTKTKRAK